MSIKPSASAEIRTLIAALGSADEVRRESAIARLAIIGPRSVERILAAYPAATAHARVAMLRSLEGIGDPRAIEVARGALSERNERDVAVAAAATLRAFLESPAAAVASEALDALVAAALDTSRDRRVRLAALDALEATPFDVRRRVEAALREDADAAVRARVGAVPTETAAADASWQEAVDGRLGDDPAALREATGRYGPEAPLSVLQRVIDAIRAREEGARDDSERAAWQTTRGAVHQALALRGSRIAVYDLRESVAAAAGPLPPAFVTALHAVGDESCLSVIAAAHRRTSDERWRSQLETAFHAIVKRDKLGRKKTARLLERGPRG